jgi:hypothetical protein
MDLKSHYCKYWGLSKPRFIVFPIQKCILIYTEALIILYQKCYSLWRKEMDA